jgi:transcriptional regulator with XRE-family HTH domain
MPTAFGAWLLKRLQLNEMNRSDLARAAGVNPSTVSKWIYADRPTPASCELIADALKIPVDRVLEAAGHRQPDTSPEGEVRKEIANLLQFIPEQLLVPFVPALRGLTHRQEQTQALGRLNRLRDAQPDDDEDGEGDEGKAEGRRWGRPEYATA